MKFWDSSAVAPLLITEPSSTKLEALYKKDPDLLVWWGSTVECASAIARRERSELLDDAGAMQAFERLRGLSLAWAEIGPKQTLRDVAVRCVRVHNLRAGDALQLAAAF